MLWGGGGWRVPCVYLNHAKGAWPNDVMRQAWVGLSSRVTGLWNPVELGPTAHDDSRILHRCPGRFYSPPGPSEHMFGTAALVFPVWCRLFQLLAKFYKESTRLQTGFMKLRLQAGSLSQWLKRTEREIKSTQTSSSSCDEVSPVMELPSVPIWLQKIG